MAPRMAWMQFVDDKGYREKVTWWNDAATEALERTDAAAIAAEVPALSNANYQVGGGLIHTDNLPLSYGAAGWYSSVADRAIIVMQDSTGHLHNIGIPAPFHSIFLSDGITLNKAHTDVDALIQAMLAHHACGRSGNQFTNCVGGYRKRVRMQRGINSLYRGPDLHMPA